MARNLKKEDAIFILYKKLYDDDFYYTISITSKGGGNYYKTWIEFKKDIDELSIIQHDNEWLCDDDKYEDRNDLKAELERRGFKVELGDYYDD